MMKSGSKDPIVLAAVGFISTTYTLPPPPARQAQEKGGEIRVFPVCWLRGTLPGTGENRR